MLKRLFGVVLICMVTAVTARADDRGYLGVVFAELPENKAKGAVVQEIFDGSPADRDGLRSGDLIVGVNDREIADVQALLDASRDLKPGDKVRIVVRRAGEKEKKEVAVTLAPRPGNPLAEIRLKKRPSLGIAFSVQPDGILAVARFLPDSLAERAGMKTGDVITSIAGHDTPDYAAILSSLAGQKDDAEVKILVSRDGQTQELNTRVKHVTPPFSPQQP
jgi:serine protease Do